MDFDNGPDVECKKISFYVRYEVECPCLNTDHESKSMIMIIIAIDKVVLVAQSSFGKYLS